MDLFLLPGGGQLIGYRVVVLSLSLSFSYTGQLFFFLSFFPHQEEYEEESRAERQDSCNERAGQPELERALSIHILSIGTEAILLAAKVGDNNRNDGGGSTVKKRRRS